MGYNLTLSCHDRPGIIAAVTTALFDCGANIIEASQYTDDATGRFFMRVSFILDFEAAGSLAVDALEAVATKHRMEWTIRRSDLPRNVLILTSKFDHCVADLLYRNKTGELEMNIVGVISNHPREAIGDLGSSEFHFLPIDPDSKKLQEESVKAIIEETGADLIILARYMQILSDDFAQWLTGRCINIHHSFLPGFKGAKPYHQAYARGVKMIGATAHYVTGDLDEGPIIAQDVETVSHTDTVADLIRKDRDIERRVLARAVRSHLEDRVLINGNKTVVFPG